MVTILLIIILFSCFHGIHFRKMFNPADALCLYYSPIGVPSSLQGAARGLHITSFFSNTEKYQARDVQKCTYLREGAQGGGAQPLPEAKTTV